MPMQVAREMSLNTTVFWAFFECMWKVTIYNVVTRIHVFWGWQENLSESIHSRQHQNWSCVGSAGARRTTRRQFILMKGHRARRHTSRQTNGLHSRKPLDCHRHGWPQPCQWVNVAGRTFPSLTGMTMKIAAMTGNIDKKFEIQWEMEQLSEENCFPGLIATTPTSEITVHGYD